MFLLCQDGDNHGEWYAISASSDESALEKEADRLNREAYERQCAEWLSSDQKGGKPIPLEERTYREFWVHEVPDWPTVDLLV